MHEIEKIIDAIRRFQCGIVVTIIRTHGSTYRRAGARAVISDRGQAIGAISGGCLERDLAERIKPWLADMQPRVVSYDSTREDDLVFGMGLGCRGVVDLLIEPFDAEHPSRLLDLRWNEREPLEFVTTLPDGETMVEIIKPRHALVVFGGGPDVEPVIAQARLIGWRADVVTTREAVDVSGYDAAVVMTHNFHRDVDILRRLLASDLVYIGLLGPRTRGDELLAEVGATRDARIFSPVGLDVGAETPEEIALSIVAEIQAVLSVRSARTLRELETPIHEARDTPASV